jgi:hypothetical protein
MIGYDKDIGGAKVDQCADIEAKTEVGNNTDKMRYKNEEDELVETYRLFPLGMSIVFPKTGIDDILIERLKKYEWVAHRMWNKGF